MRLPRRIGAATLVAAALFAPLLSVPSATAAPADDIRINEIESNDDTQDWVELVNTGSSTVDLSGWRLKDNDDARTFAIADGTVIPAGGFVAIDVDVTGTPGQFGLGATDAARLYLSDGTTLVDSHSYTGHASTTYGRCPDGSGAFVVTASSTKGAANACTVAPAAVVTINEVESSGGTPGDWIELKNTGLGTADVSGYRLKDSDDARTFAIPAGSTIPAGGHLAVEVDVTGGFGLGGDDSARFFTPDGTTLIDAYTWTGGHAATTFGRCPDGIGAFTLTDAPTKGAANDCPPPALPSIVINEIESNGGTPGDWVELKNTGSAPVDLSGWKVKDNDDTRDVAIPAGTVVAPGAYFLVEEALTGFGLGTPDAFRLYLADGVTLVDSHAWTPHAATTLGRCPDGTGAITETTSSTKSAANDCGPAVRINEVESNGDTQDWIELRNNGVAPVDVSGWRLKDDDDARTFAIPAGSTIPAGGYLAVDVDATGTPGEFGLGGNDKARLYLADGSTLVDETAWTAHAATTWGRCPDATGDFGETAESTKGAANVCAGETTYAAWPGSPDVATADVAGTFSSNLSGLDFAAGATPADDALWAVVNGPGSLQKLVKSGDDWVKAPGWESGAVLHYGDGAGDVDAEGVVQVGGDLFVSTERNNAGGGSRPSVLRYPVPTTGGPLSAAQEWNLASLLPSPIGANAGLEGITFIDDAVLADAGLVDAATGAVYDPADYPGHGGGLFFVGLEANGLVYGVALASDGAHLVTTIDPGLGGIMELEYEPASGGLWAFCDDGCQGRSAVLRVATDGADDGSFVVDEAYERPTGMPNLNNEGVAIAPESRCEDGLKPVFWSDDSSTGGHALRVGAIRCVGEDTSVDPGTPSAGGGTGTAATGGTGTIATSGGGLLPGTGTRVSVLVLLGILLIPAGALLVLRARSEDRA